MADQPAIITPPGREPADVQNVTLFRIYIIYRCLLSVLLLLTLLTADTRALVATVNPDLYLYSGLAYMALNITLLGLSSSRFVGSQPLLFLTFLVEILALTLMADASGGIESGLPILLIVTAAASAIMINTRIIATLVAAIAVIAILADTMRLINEQVLGLGSLFPAGLLGILIFAVSLLIQVVAGRVRRAEALARKRAADLYALQRLNEQIVQQLQTGILMVYDNASVRVMNLAATQLLDPGRPVPLEQGRRLEDYNAELAQQFQNWKDAGHHTPTPIAIGEENAEMIANFRSLQDSASSDSLIFLEDYSPVTQYAQSLKLASLGRLTASIAHEIRNPLGAMSHAAQLLSESEELDAEDRRMSDIIIHHAHRMNAIIENVMQISRRKPPSAERLNISSWLTDFRTEYLATRTEHAEINLQLDIANTTVSFDPEHLRRILNNLLDNALRHSQLDTGRAGAIITSAVEPMRQRLLIDVIDYGAGVAESERAKLFEPFYTTAEEGTGLGLFLCKELCEINNATLVYCMTGQQQSCFRLSVAL